MEREPADNAEKVFNFLLGGAEIALIYYFVFPGLFFMVFFLVILIDVVTNTINEYKPLIILVIIFIIFVVILLEMLSSLLSWINRKFRKSSINTSKVETCPISTPTPTPAPAPALLPISKEKKVMKKGNWEKFKENNYKI